MKKFWTVKVENMDSTTNMEFVIEATKVTADYQRNMVIADGLPIRFKIGTYLLNVTKN